MADIDWEKGVMTPPTTSATNQEPDWESGKIIKPASAARKLGDLGLSVAKGVVAVPEAAVGLADLVSGGRAGKFLENEGGAVGFRPKQAKEFLTSLQSDDLNDKRRQFQQADGIVDKFGVAVTNPSLIANSVAESVPLMGAGAVPARALLAAAPRVGAIGAGAFGEGLVGAGSSAEQIRQETEDGLLTGKQAALAGGSGLATGVFGAVGGAASRRLGIVDVDTALTQGTLNAGTAAANKGLLRRTAEGVLSEGVLEELPQSLSEQALQNIALDKPVTEGLADAGVMGVLAGGVMGGGAAALTRQPQAQGLPDPNAGQPPAPPPAQPPAPAAEQPPAPFVNPPSLTGNDAAAMLGGQSNGLMGGADPLRAVVKPSESMGIDPNAGVLSRTAAEAVDGPASMEAAVRQAERDMAALAAEDNPETGADPVLLAPSLLDQVDNYVNDIGFSSPTMVAAKFGITVEQAGRLLAQLPPMFDNPQGASNVSNTDAAGALAAGTGGAVGADAAGGRPDAGLLAPDAGQRAAGTAGTPAPAVQESVAAPVSGRDSDKALTKGPTQTKAKVKGLKNVIARRKAEAAPAAPAAAPAVEAVAEPAPAPAETPSTTTEPTNALQTSNAVETTQARQEKAADVPEQVGATPDAIVPVKTVYGDTVNVRQSDLDGDRKTIPTFTKEGKRKIGSVVARDNLDPTGEKQAAQSAEDANSPMFDVITRKGGGFFATRMAAAVEMRKRGLTDSHEVVEASTLGATDKGFVVKRKQAAAATPVAAPAPAPAAAPASAEPILAKREDGTLKNKNEYTEDEWKTYTKSVIDAKLGEPAKPSAWSEAENNFTNRPVHRYSPDPRIHWATVQNPSNGVYVIEYRIGDKVVSTEELGDNLTAVKFHVVAKVKELDAKQASHQDPGEKPEAATKGVVNDSLKTAAKNEDTKPSEMRKWLLAEIDKELLQAPDRADYDEAVKRLGEKDAISMYTGNGMLGRNTETGFITFDVPGDGKFKVRNSVRGLLEFRKTVNSSPGFKDSGQKTAKPDQNDGVQGGSGGQMAAVTNMIEEGDFEAARDYAEAVGIKLEDVKVPRGDMKPAWEKYLKDGTLPPAAWMPSKEWQFPDIGASSFVPDSEKRSATLTRVADGSIYVATVKGNLEGTSASYTVTKDGKEIGRTSSRRPFSETLRMAEDAMPEANDTPAPSKAKDTGWSMAGTGYGGKRYFGRNITLADGREVVARIYENAGRYNEVEVKVDGARKFTVTDEYNAQDKADAFIRTLTAQEVGPFGPILTQYRGDAQGAIKALTDLKDGEAVAALNHPDVGDIDLVWGKEGSAAEDYEDGMGLAKIIKKHSEVLDDLQGFVSSLSVQKRSENRVILANRSGRALVRLDWDGKVKHWLLTAYDEEKKASVANEGRTGVSAGADSTPPAEQGTEARQSVAQLPEGFKPAGEPFYRDGELIQGYAPFDLGQRVTMKDSGGQSGVIDLFISPDKNGVFDGAMVKFDNGVEQIVKLNKLEAKAAPAATGTRRDPTKVSMFNPYSDGDIVTIDGQDWTVKADTPGWYLTTTGNWRGQHPTIRNVKAMADLIREVEQAAEAKPAEKAKTPKLTAEDLANQDKALLDGVISVQGYMDATGLTDEDVGVAAGDGLRQQADREAKAADPYHQGIQKMQEALSDQMRVALDAPSSTPPQRKSKEERMGRITRDRATLDMIARGFEHPFDNRYVTKLSPMLKARFNKQWESIKTGEFAKQAFQEASYKLWAQKVIDKAREKLGMAAKPAAPAPEAPKKGLAGVRAKKAAEAEAQRAAYFTPGNIVKGYGGHDRVLEYTPADADGNWSVRVQRVMPKDGKWMDTPNERPRWHSTQPEAKELAAGPVVKAPAVAEQELGAQATGAVENFGERLPPARRNMAAKLSEDLTDDKIATLPLSQIWPAAENDAIEDISTAAVAYVLRDAIPAKPRVAYKVKAWVSKVKVLRDFAAQVVRGDISRDKLVEEMQKVYALRDLAAKIKLLEQVDRAKWKQIGDVSEAPNAVRYEGGQSIPTPSTSVTIDGKNHWLRGSGNVLDHMDAIKALLGDAAPEAKMQFEIRQESRGDRKVFINKKGDKENRRLMEFATVEEARKAVKEQYADLVAAWEGVKSRDNITERDLRSETNRERAGKDHRKGRDVTAEEFEKQFGFRGGEFGSWMKQGTGAQERQFMLNSSYDALMDLSDLLGIPPKAISLEGSLGIAFGSRGSGWASAHFEPSNLVINLTKTRGAGALAHEWFHALDNYFARKRGGEVPFAGDQNAYRRDNFVTYKTTPMMVRKDGRGTPLTKERLAEWRKSSPESKYLTADQWMEDPNHKQGVRAEVEQAFADLVKTLDASPMLKRARLLDGVKDAEGYWSRVIERAARSFENYIQTRMMEQGYHNDFLANVRAAPEVGKNVERYPYLLPSEIAPVSDAFQTLFDTIQTKEDDAGNVAMFSQGLLAPASPGPKPTPDQIQRLVDKVQKVALDVLPVTVIGNPSQVPGLQVPAGAKPTGVLTGGRIYLFSDNIRSMGDAYATLFHELFHLGLQKVIPAEDYAAMLGKFSKNLLVQRFVREWKASPEGVEKAGTMPAAAYDALAAEEALAMVSEELSADGIGTNRLPGMVKAMLSWLANVADRLGFPGNFGDWIRGLTRTDAEKFVSDMVRAAMGGEKNLGRARAKYGTELAQMTQQTRLSQGRTVEPQSLAASLAARQFFASGKYAKGLTNKNVAVADAAEVMGFDLAPLVINEKRADMPTTPMRYGMDGVIHYNQAVPRTRAEDVQYMIEEVLHSIDHVGGRKTISASSKRLANGGDLRVDLEAAYAKSAAMKDILDHPLDEPELTESEVVAELFARAGMVYYSNPELLRVTAPKTYGAFNDAFGSPANQSGLPDQVRQLRPAGVQAGQPVGNGPRVPGAPAALTGQQRADELQRIRQKIAQSFDADADGAGIRFSGDGDSLNTAALSRSPRELAGMATDQLKMTLTAPGKLSWWSKTVGTMYGLAERHPAFKPVFNAAQSFIDDVSYYATDAADMAPKMLPKLENWKDIAKSPISAEDNKAIEAPINEGTLLWARDESGRPVKVAELEAQAADMSADQKARRLLRNDKISEGVLRMWQGLPQEQYEKLIESRYESQMLNPGVVWTDAELKAIWKLNDNQIGLYREVRAAIDKSLDNLAKSDLVRFVGKDGASIKDQIMEAGTVDEAALLARDYFISLAEADPDRAEMLLATANGIMDRADKVTRLKEQGYAPLSRFGKYTVDVVTEEGRQYFGLFESMREANQMAARMRGEFGKDAVSQGTLSDESFKLFQGITPETLELFGNMLGLSDTGDSAQDQAFQAYLKLTKNNRSAMKRLIQRKGILGYSQDVGRVLANFIYSNARQTAAALHIGDLTDAINAIPQGQGEVKDVAVKLGEYIKNPQEEAQAFRGLLFAQYLGGNISSAIINALQPFQVSFPYLSQFGGVKQAGAEMLRATRDYAAGKKNYEPDLARALKNAEDDGTVSPQEVFQLMAQAKGAGSLRSGDGTVRGELLAKGGNAWSKTALAWGKVFGVAEQFNRRTTFVAAYRIAKAQEMADPAAFAKKAVQETQFIYSKANRPQWARGAIGATIFTFKTYSISYIELLHRMATQGGPEGKRAALLAVAVLLLMGGAGGLPFMEDGEDIADTIAQIMGYNFSSKQAKQELLEELFGEAAAQFIERGISGVAGVPIDVSGRFGMGNLVPGTGAFLQRNSNARDVLEVLGPAGDLLQRGKDSFMALAKGNVYEAGLNMSPVAIRNLAKGADMAATDMYRDTKGFKVIETTGTEAGLKAIGFQPNTVAKVQEANYLMQRQKDFYNTTAQNIRAKWARGLFEKDDGMVAEAREAMDAWNEKNPDQRMSPNMPAIWKRVREMAKDKDQRIADTAPKAMRAQFREETARVREAL